MFQGTIGAWIHASVGRELERDLATATQRIAELESQLRTQASEHSLANRRLEDEIGRLHAKVKQLEQEIANLFHAKNFQDLMRSHQTPAVEVERWAKEKAHFAKGGRVQSKINPGAGGQSIGAGWFIDHSPTWDDERLYRIAPDDTASKCPECGTNHGCLCDDAPPVQTEEKA